MSNHDWLGPPRYIPEDGAPHPDWDDLLDDLINSGLTPDEIRARIAPVGAVLAYYSHGTRRPCGQAIGADGSGDFAFIIHGTPDLAEQWALDHVRTRATGGCKLSSVVLVRSDQEGWYGTSLTIIPEDNA